MRLNLAAALASCDVPLALAATMRIAAAEGKSPPPPPPPIGRIPLTTHADEGTQAASASPSSPGAAVCVPTPPNLPSLAATGIPLRLAPTYVPPLPLQVLCKVGGPLPARVSPATARSASPASAASPQPMTFRTGRHSVAAITALSSPHAITARDVFGRASGARLGARARWSERLVAGALAAHENEATTVDGAAGCCGKEEGGAQWREQSEEDKSPTGRRDGGEAPRRRSAARVELSRL